MNVDTDIGKQYVKILGGMALGDSMELTSLAPGLSPEPVVAVLTIIKPEQKWEFDLYWHNMRIGRASAERKGETLEFKEHV